MKFLSILVLICTCNFCFAQEVDQRRANYFETFVEIKEPIDSLVLIKSKRILTAFHEGKRIKGYIVSLGMEPIGKKEYEGDMKTPEGLYFIDKRDSISSFHKNLNVNYPNFSDSLFAVAQGKSPGGDIKIHGFPNLHNKSAEKDLLNSDWTLGCIAISDFEVDELFKWVIEMCPILILP